MWGVGPRNSTASNPLAPCGCLLDLKSGGFSLLPPWPVSLHAIVADGISVLRGRPQVTLSLCGFMCLPKADPEGNRGPTAA